MAGLSLGAFAALRHRDFRWFWAGQGVSLVGTHMQRVAVAWHVYDLTHSAAMLGLLGLARFLPVLLFALPGGVMADRFDRRRLLIAATAVLALASGVLWACTTWNVMSVTILYAMVALQSAAGAIGGTARQALVPALVPVASLQRALALTLLTWDVTGFAGPALGGLVLAQFGVATIYAVDAASYLVVMFSLWRMETPTEHVAAPSEAPLVAMAAGIRWVVAQPLIRTTMLLDFFVTLLGQATVLFPIFAAEILHVDEAGLGLLYAAPAAGSALTGFVVALLPPMVRHGAWIAGSVCVYGLATVVFGASTEFHVTLAALAVSGGADTISTMLRQTLRQRRTPDDMRGRMTGVNMLFFSGGPQLGELESGLAADWLGASVAVMAGGGGVLVALALALVWAPALARYRDDVARS